MVENSKYDPYDIPYSPKGFKLDGWVELYGMLNGSHDLGYDPMRDFRECYIPHRHLRISSGINRKKILQN